MSDGSRTHHALGRALAWCWEAMGTVRAQIAIGAILLAALIAGGLWPAADARRALAAHRAETARLGAAIVEATRDRRELGSRVADLRARARSIEAHPPDAGRLNADVGALLTTAERTGLSVDGVNISTPDTRDGDAFADVSIDASARSAALVAFLREAGRSHPYFSLGEVSIGTARSARDGRGPVRIDVALTLVWRGRATPLEAIGLLEDER